MAARIWICISITSAVAVALSACSNDVGGGSTGSGGSATVSTGAGGAAPPSTCPVEPKYPAFLLNSQVPSGACTGPVTCDFSAIDAPCPNPQDLPPQYQWHCTCASVQWMCTLMGKTHSICGPAPDASDG